MPARLPAGRVAMLEAHVRFEVDRLTGAAFEREVADEVAALFGWLGGVPLADLLTAGDAADLLLRLSRPVRLPADDGANAPADDGANAPAVDAAAVGEAVRAALAAGGYQVGDLVRRRDYDRLVLMLAGMRGVRAEIVEQVTTSEVYTQLLSHVVYRGIKNYLLTENALARRIPGAASLVRLGQRSLSSAAPNLEKGIDRQLTAFVAASMQDILRDSRRYLDTALDDEELIVGMAAVAWDANRQRPVADLFGLVGDRQATELTALLSDAWQHLAGTEAFAAVVEAGVGAVYAAHGERPVADVLADLGVTAEAVTASAVAVLRPPLLRAYDTGYLEERVRARLEPFYRSYREAEPGSGTAARRGGSAARRTGPASAGQQPSHEPGDGHERDDGHRDDGSGRPAPAPARRRRGG